MKVILSLVAIAILIFLAQALNLQELVQSALVWIEGLGAFAAIAFILLYTLATVLFIPGSILTLGGGALFGLLWGSIYVFIAATLGATAAFLVGRYLARGWVSRQIEGNDKFRAIDRAVARGGGKIVFLTRLSPVFPFNLLNYAFGITQVSLKDYVLGSVGMLPGTIMYVYIGSLAGNLAKIGAGVQPTNPETQALQWAIRIVGFIATVAVTLYVTRLAKTALNETVASGDIEHDSARNL